jgi:hypothetical protein
MGGADEKMQRPAWATTAVSFTFPPDEANDACVASKEETVGFGVVDQRSSPESRRSRQRPRKVTNRIGADRGPGHTSISCAAPSWSSAVVFSPDLAEQ